MRPFVVVAITLTFAGCGAEQRTSTPSVEPSDPVNRKTSGTKKPGFADSQPGVSINPFDGEMYMRLGDGNMFMNMNTGEMYLRVGTSYATNLESGEMQYMGSW